MKYEEIYDMLTNIQMDIYEKMLFDPDNEDLQSVHLHVMEAIWSLKEWKGLV